MAMARSDGLAGRGALLRRLLVEPTDQGGVQFVRYGLVGGAAFVVDFALFWGLTSRAGLHYLAANLVGFCGGLLTSYALSVAWVFRAREGSSAPGRFLLFALVGVAGVGLNELTLWALVGGAHLHPAPSKLLAAVGVYFWNFLARRRILA